ncbi:MAG TPA: M48 family metalloprotease [Marmoricola sp.]|nr:M48 family metalloprotease [Marmoricola sp.]
MASSTSGVDPETPAAEPLRPDVLGYPSPTTARYLIFAVALLASGLFIGNFVHNWAFGDRWQATVATCEAEHGGSFVTSLLQNDDFSRCVAGAEATRVAVTVAGAVVVGALAVLLLYVAPLVVVRRRALRPLPDRLGDAQERFAALAADAGLGRRVRPMLGPAGQRDAFSFGAPGRYRVALPPAVAVRFRDAATFDPLVAHELAHVAHRDVALAWLARLVWLALAPVLALPIVVGVLTGDTSILGTYWWRVALLAVVVALLSSELLRSREYGADLRAARLPGGWRTVAGLVRRARSPERSGWRAVLARHPTTEERLSVLEDPAVVTRTGFADGLTGAFLAALTLPLIVATVRPLFAPVDRTALAYVLGAWLLGPLLAGSIGLGLWRAVLVARARGGGVTALPVALGAGLGIVLGQAVSLQQAGLGRAVGLAQPAWLLVSGLAAVGATLVAAGLGHLWAEWAPRLPGVRVAWVAAVLLGSMVFSSLLWSTTVFQTVADLGGWSLARAALMQQPLAPWWMFWLVLCLAVAAALPMAARPPADATVPDWLVEGGGRHPWPAAPSTRLVPALAVGAVAGGTASSALALFRAVQGAAVGPAETYARVLAYDWMVAVVAGTTVAAATMVHRAQGAGTALLAGPVAALVGTVGFLVLSTSLGGSLDWLLFTTFVRPAVVLGFYATLLLGPVVAVVSYAARGRPLPARGSSRLPAALLVAALLAGVMSAGTLAVRSVLVQDAAAAVSSTAGEASAYESEVVPRITGTYTEVSTLAQRIWEDPAADGPARAAAIGSQVVPPLEDLVHELEQRPVGSAEVARMHEEAVTALQAALGRYRVLAASEGTLTRDDVADLQRLQEEEARRWREWGRLRQELATAP